MDDSYTLQDVLTRNTKEGELYQKLDNDRVLCYACGHRCVIPEGRQGVCKIRFNTSGRLMVPSGYVGALQADPIEKKPFFHAFPGTVALSFGMLGCDYHCSYCQNWITSQALRDANAVSSLHYVNAERLVQIAHEYGAPVITSTYNEPLITSEWAVEIMRIARQQGLVGSYVSNGNGTPEVLDYIRPHVDLFKIDLKGFNDKNYRKLGGKLQHVLDTIRMTYERAFWVEVVTLVVPGFNDSEEELRDCARYIASVSRDIPWHVTAFHSDYRMTDRDDTPVQRIIRSAEIGYEEGLRYVYAGNIPGMVKQYESTFCPNCNTEVIQRQGFHVLSNRLVDGHCPKCKEEIPGVWSKKEIQKYRSKIKPEAYRQPDEKKN
jgi:pyruvate formate lyase activating enzyme